MVSDTTAEPIQFVPGEKALWIVGWPGPDVDECEIVSDNGDGTYVVRYQVHGKGPWHTSEAHTADKPGAGILRRLAKKTD